MSLASGLAKKAIDKMQQGSLGSNYVSRRGHSGMSKRDYKLNHIAWFICVMGIILAIFLEFML